MSFGSAFAAPHGLLFRRSTPSARCRLQMQTRRDVVRLFTVVPVALWGGSGLARSILDEEIERRAVQDQKEAALTLGAMRAAFEALERAMKQLDDLERFVRDDDWDGVRKFARLFNNAVVREGMEPTAKRLEGPEQRKKGLGLAKSVTDSLIALDKDARAKKRESALMQLQAARDTMLRFQELKP